MGCNEQRVKPIVSVCVIGQRGAHWLSLGPLLYACAKIIYCKGLVFEPKLIKLFSWTIIGFGQSQP